MKYEKRHEGEILIFSLEGDFDSRNAGDLKEEIRNSILNGEAKVIINLEGVTYIDSAGLGTLVSALKTAKENDASIWLAGMSSQVKMVIELTRLHHVFDIYKNLEEALEELGSPGALEANG